MASTDIGELPQAVQLLLQDVWKTLSLLRTQHASGAWLSEHQWKKFKQDCLRAIDRTKRENLSIGIVASPRSGKSTLMNALLGIALLPTEAPASSNRCIRVHYTPRRKGSKLKLLEANERTVLGLEGVRQRLSEMLESASNDDWHMEPSLELNAAFCKSLGSEADSVVKLDLMEIPSLSTLDVHSPLRDRLTACLEDLDGAFFLIDGTKLKTPQESEILKELKEAFSTYSPQQTYRLHFCVTKMDLMNGDSEQAEIQSYVANLIQVAGFNAYPSQVFVMSPLHALLSRLVISDKSEGEVHAQFGQHVWGDAPAELTDKAAWKAKAATVLEQSGLPKMEEQILSSFHRNCESLKLMTLLDDAIKILQYAMDAASAQKMTMARTLNEMRHGIDRLKTQLEVCTMQMEATKSELQQIEPSVTIKVQEILTHLKNDLLQRIGAALSCEVREDRTAHDLPSGWTNIRQDFLALIHHAEPDAKQAQELVKELHEEIIGQIRSEMEVAWKVVETLMRDRHFEHVLSLNQDLDRLSKLLEPVVVKDLNIQIEPADMKLKPVNGMSFQKDVHELLSSVIREETFDRSALYKLFWGAQYTVYFFDGGSMQEFFENIVREITDEAIHQLQASVHRHVSGQIASSEEKIRGFGETFTQSIESSIESRTLNISSSAASMQRAIEDIDSLKKLKTLALGLRHRLEMGLDIQQPSEQIPVQPDLSIHLRGSEENDGGKESLPRYVPPRSRSEITPNWRLDRADSFPFSEVSESAVESPRSGQFVRSNGRDSWRVGRTASGTWSPRTPQVQTQRSAWASAPPVPPREAHLQAANVADSFSPRSSFFRNFQQTPRAVRGRGQDPPSRTGSWTGGYPPSS